MLTNSKLRMTLQFIVFSEPSHKAPEREGASQIRSHYMCYCLKAVPPVFGKITAAYEILQRLKAPSSPDFTLAFCSCKAERRQKRTPR